MFRAHLLAIVVIGLLPSLLFADEVQIELMIVTEGDVLRGLSYSAASGPYVATIGVTSDTGVTTGAIASQDPVQVHQSETGFGLYTSPVGSAEK